MPDIDLTDLMTWTCDGLPFARMVDGDTYPLWFTQEAIAQVDHILASDQAYIDVGGTMYGTFEVHAIFTTAAARNTMMGKTGKVVAISNGKGLTRVALVRRVVPVQMASTSLFQADCTFDAG